MMALSERDIRVFHYAIVNSVKTPDVVSELVAADVISTEDGDRIKKYFLRDELAKGSEEMMQCFYDSVHPGKEQALLMAFERSKYSHLKKLVEGTEFEARSYTYTKIIIQKFTPLLEKGLLCADILPDLCSRGVLKDEDIEYITAVQINKGNTYATIVLLERMQCRVSPDKWYFDFLDVLSKNGYEHLVEELEPDFINNPSSFMSKFDGIGTKASSGLSTHEGRLLYYRDEFVRCIQDPKLVSLLAASSVISEKYPYLKGFLESSRRLTTSFQRERQIIRLFFPMLEENLQCLDIIAELLFRGVLNSTDREIIMNLYGTRGCTYATTVLLERMQCRAPPQVWYYAFLETLRKTGYNHIIERIEEDFLENPEQFRPSSDCEEGESNSNDLQMPPATPERSDASNSSWSDSRTESQFRLGGNDECGDENHQKEDGERMDYDSLYGDASERFEINSISPNYTS